VQCAVVDKPLSRTGVFTAAILITVIYVGLIWLVF